MPRFGKKDDKRAAEDRLESVSSGLEEAALELQKLVAQMKKSLESSSVESSGAEDDV